MYFGFFETSVENFSLGKKCNEVNCEFRRNPLTSLDVKHLLLLFYESYNWIIYTNFGQSVCYCIFKISVSFSPVLNQPVRHIEVNTCILASLCEIVTQNGKKKETNKNKEAIYILRIASIHFCSSGKDPFLNIYFDHLC